MQSVEHPAEQPLAEFGMPAAAAITLARRDAAELPILKLWPRFGTATFQREFHDFATRHEIQGLLLVALERAGPIAGVPAEVVAEHRRFLQLLRRRAAMWDLERDFVLNRLSGAGIQPVLLKGAALRLVAYRDSAERQFGDVDVLIQRAEIPRAVETLTSAGYRGDPDTDRYYLEHHHHLILRKETGFVVELHWGLEPPGSPFLLDPEEFQRGARAAAGTHGLLVPSAEHMVLHLATQNVDDGFSLLRRMVDIDRVITAAPAFSWELLASDAIRMQVNVPTALSLRLCSLLLRTELPEGWLRTFAVPRAVRHHLALFDPINLLVRQRARKRASVGRLLVLWCIGEKATRLRLLRQLRTRDPGWLAYQFAPGGSARTGPGWRLVWIGKMLLFQIGMYPTSGIGWTPKRRKALGFWREG